MINSYYARQASTKTKAAHRARAKAGMYLGGHAPFGYIKDPDDRHHLIIDPSAADIVREIFQMFSDGVGYVRMTKILRERKILNPIAYFNQNNPDYYKSEYWRKPFDWHSTSIRVILMNRAYLGQLVLEDVRRNASAAKLATQKYKNMLTAAKAEKKKRETEKYKRELKAIEKRLAELDKILNKLYEDMALEKLTEDRYQIMSQQYEEEQSGLKERKIQLTEMITRAESVYENIDNFLPLIQRYTDISELNAHILNELIHKIVVYEKTDNPDGSKNQRVDIHYKFIGYVEMKDMLGRPMVIPVEEDAEVEEGLKTRAG